MVIQFRATATTAATATAQALLGPGPMAAPGGVREAERARRGKTPTSPGPRDRRRRSDAPSGSSRLAMKKAKVATTMPGTAPTASDWTMRAAAQPLLLVLHHAPFDPHQEAGGDHDAAGEPEHEVQPAQRPVPELDPVQAFQELLGGLGRPVLTGPRQHGAAGAVEVDGSSSRGSPGRRRRAGPRRSWRRRPGGAPAPGRPGRLPTAAGPPPPWRRARPACPGLPAGGRWKVCSDSALSAWRSP